MLTVNCSVKDQYYTQRNNKSHPLSSCFATSIINKLANQRIKIRTPNGNYVEVAKFEDRTGIQPEDYLTQLLLSEPARKRFIEIVKRKPHNDEQRFWYAIIEWATNFLLLGDIKKKVTFKQLTIQEILYSVLRRKPVVCGGKFTESGHIVCVVGFTTNQLSNKHVFKTYRCDQIDVSKVESIIFDDPYGQYDENARGYIGLNGNDCMISVKEFDRVVGGYSKEKNVIV